ncbi:CLUMA_CG005682, isoform A [Clunio marinus]|uniref:CLUMA_CG005682, isoform A n=1 Tax=Clunio marinus TaxID=568069 RepID=A0A1J1HVI7_9DIPT|nr:CLUMA_CG005682, isoform A [Clunio marinus]
MNLEVIHNQGRRIIQINSGTSQHDWQHSHMNECESSCIIKIISSKASFIFLTARAHKHFIINSNVFLITFPFSSMSMLNKKKEGKEGKEDIFRLVDFIHFSSSDGEKRKTSQSCLCTNNY